jgi:hypothetical protein
MSHPRLRTCVRQSRCKSSQRPPAERALEVLHQEAFDSSAAVLPG